MFSSELQNFIIVCVCLQVYSYINILLLNIVLLLLRPDLKLVFRNYLTLTVTINIGSVICYTPCHPVASAPTLLSAVQSGPTGILVSWNIPSPLENTTGYTIYYTGSISGKSSVSVSDGSTDNYTLTGLQNGESYNISIEGTSIHLPSQLIYYVNIIPLSKSSNTQNVCNIH